MGMLLRRHHLAQNVEQTKSAPVEEPKEEKKVVETPKEEKPKRKTTKK